MTKPIRTESSGIAEEQVADFLVAHPEFFERHASVLARLRLPHQRGSAAISLVERQVLVKSNDPKTPMLTVKVSATVAAPPAKSLIFTLRPSSLKYPCRSAMVNGR